MFEGEKLSPGDIRTGYDARTDYDREFPPDGMSDPGRGRKAWSPKPFWTPARIVTAAVMIMLLLDSDALHFPEHHYPAATI